MCLANRMNKIFAKMNIVGQLNPVKDTQHIECNEMQGKCYCTQAQTSYNSAIRLRIFDFHFIYTEEREREKWNRKRDGRGERYRATHTRSQTKRLRRKKSRYGDFVELHYPYIVWQFTPWRPPCHHF